jgi:hypothetical protein
MKLTTRQVFVIVLFLGIFLLTIRPVTDPDFWWHLRTGQLIVETRQIPVTDPFSYTRSGTPWVTHEWLSEILIFFTYKAGGFNLLMLLFSLIITAAYATAYYRTSATSRPFIAGFVMLLGASASNPLWGVRPQMITLLFFGLFLLILDRFIKSGNARDLISLPVLMLLWVNLHGGYILGLAAIGVYMAGNLFDLLWKRFKHKESDRGLLKVTLLLLGAFVVSALAALVNPNGYKILLYPFQTLTDPAMQQYIQEWQSPDFSQAMWIPFAIMILLLIYTGLRGGGNKSTTQTLLLLIFLYMGLRDMRNIPLFAMVAIPVLSTQLNALITIPLLSSTSSRPSSIINWVLTLLIVVAVGSRFLQQVGNQESDIAARFPATAVKWIREYKPSGRIFNLYDWGGYLIWTLYPEYQVYIDGRADVYGSGFLTDYKGISAMKPGWQQTFERYDISTVLIEPDSVMANFLRQSSDWRVSYEDKTSVLFSMNP